MEEFKFAYDSLLEGTGFEPSVPREAPGIPVVSALGRAGLFCVRGTKHK
jgi:hypothetical protein